MTRLILGCGYLGRRVAALWRAEGHAVAALTRSEARAAELRAEGIVPILGDVTDIDSLRRLPEAETVLWAVGYDRASGRPRRDVFIDGLRNAARSLLGRCGRWIQISSTSVYGQNAGEWVDEASECVPQQPNGVECLEAERLLWTESGRAPSTRVVLLRLSGIYGPGRLLQRVSALKSGAVLTGNPEAWLNLIHGDDAARAVLAAERRAPAGSTWLVSDDRPIRRREYYESLARLVGAPAPRYADLPEDSPERTALNKRCGNRRLRTELECELEFPTIDAGLPHALRSEST